jgi:hypothetical protein
VRTSEVDGLVFIGRHMFMPASGGGFIRMEITDDRKLRYAYMITKEDCPLHLKVDRLPEVDS